MSHITMNPGNPFAPPLNDLRSERAPPNINFCELPSCILVPTMHTHCCIPLAYGQCFVQFSQITQVYWLNLELCLGFPKPVPPLVLCSNVLALLGWRMPSSWWMPTHSWTLCTLSLNDVVSVQHQQTPLTGNEFQGWKYSAHINCHTHRHYHCTALHNIMNPRPSQCVKIFSTKLQNKL